MKTSIKISNYKGVNWNSKAGKWKASIKYSSGHSDLGLHDSEQDAAAAYRIALFEYCGQKLPNRVDNPFIVRPAEGANANGAMRSTIRNKWLCQIIIGNDLFHLGYFDTEKECAAVYAEAYVEAMSSLAKKTS